jgi:predicted transcriptional regulator
MKGRRMPSPEELTRPRATRNPITFRLNDDDWDALHALAARAKSGPSSLARRIVEHYIREQASRKGAKRSAR